jgi:hypothetical protein
MSIVDKIQIYYTREIDSKPKKKSVVFGAFLTLNIIFFVFYGIIPGMSAYKQKRETYQEYQEILENLNVNIEKAQKISEYLKQNDAIDQLDTAITETPDSQQYLIDLLEVTSNNGYAISKLNFSTYESNSVEFNVKLIGPHENIRKLVQEIENMERFTKIESIKLSTSKLNTDKYVDIKAQIFYLKRR